MHFWHYLEFGQISQVRAASCTALPHLGHQLQPPGLPGHPHFWPSHYLLRVDNSEDGQNSGKLCTCDYSFIMKDAIRTSQMKRLVGQSLVGSHIQTLGLQDLLPLSTSVCITNEEAHSSFECPDFLLGFHAQEWLNHSPRDWTQVPAFLPPSLPQFSEQDSIWGFKPQLSNYMVHISDKARPHLKLSRGPPWVLLLA